jgi:hypothetical protein
MKVDGGIDASKLPASDRNAAIELFDTLAEYGIFTTRGGEVEHWLPSLKVPGKKTDWTIAMLDRLGRDPNLPDYVRPQPNDVWGFMREIVHWVQNTSRKGTN